MLRKHSGVLRFDLASDSKRSLKWLVEEWQAWTEADPDELPAAWPGNSSMLDILSTQKQASIQSPRRHGMTGSRNAILDATAAATSPQHKMQPNITIGCKMLNRGPTSAT